MAMDPSQLNLDFGLHSGLMRAITQRLFGLNHLYLYLPSRAVDNLHNRVLPDRCSAARPRGRTFRGGGNSAYPATLHFRDRREPLIVQHLRSDNKSASLGCCRQWGALAWESLSPLQMCRVGAPQEFCPSNSGEGLSVVPSSWMFYSWGLPALGNVGEHSTVSLRNH